MATTRTSTIKSSGGDYTSLSAWESAEQGVLTTAWGVAVSSVVGTYTAGETLNFTGSGATATFRTLVSGAMRFEVLTGTPAAGDVITGATSLATSTLDSITYSDGEIRQAECYAFTDLDNAVTVAGATTDATRYRRVYAAPGAEAGVPWRASGAYILSVTNATGAFSANEQFGRVERIQISVSGGATVARTALQFTANTAENVRVVGCHFRTTDTGVTAVRRGVGGSTALNVGDTNYIINCVASGFATTDTASAGFYATDGTNYWYNCTAYGCEKGYLQAAGTVHAKNCLAANCTTDFSGTFGASTNNNASEDATAPGTSARVNQTFAFVDKAAGDYHLAHNDVGACGYGADLSRDTVYPFSTDFDNCTRVGAWCIGADQAEPRKHYLERVGRRKAWYKDRYPWIWTRAYRPAGGGAGAQTATVSAAPVIVHAPQVTVTVGAVTRSLSPGSVVIHAPQVATSAGALTRVLSAASLVVHAPQLTVTQTTPGATTIGAASVVVHAPRVTTSAGAVSRTLAAAPVILHAPRVATAAGALTRAIGAAGVVVHAPGVSVSVGAATRVLSAAPVVVHAPRVATMTGAVTRTIAAASMVVHAPALTVSISFSQTKAIGAASMLLHAPALTAYTLFFPVPPLGAAPDDLRQAVSVDDLRTAVSVDNLSASVSLY